MKKARRHAERVALFFPSLAGGGLERVMLTLANSFVARGLYVDLVIVKREGAYTDEVDPRVRLVDLGARSLRTSLWALIRYLRQARPMVLLSALNGANTAALLARALSLTTVRIVLTQHNTLRHRSWGGRASRRSLSRPFIPWLYRHADQIIAVSKGLTKEVLELTGLPERRVATIYSPVITPEVARLSKEPVDHPWFRSGQTPVVLGVGRLVPQKDFPTLLHAFARVRRSRRVRLVILGEGPDRPTLERMARDLGVEEDVALPGFVRNPYAWMAQAGVFVLSSAWEGFGNVLVEALACGAPVVSTDCPHGPSEILQGGDFGELVPVGDDEALAGAIIRVLNGNGLPVPAEALKPFTLDAAVDAYLRILNLPHSSS